MNVKIGVWLSSYCFAEFIEAIFRHANYRKNLHGESKLAHYNVTTGAGLSSYRFTSKKEAICELKKAGFRPANYRRNLHGGSKLARRIRKIMVGGAYAMEHPYDGTKAYIGYHYVGTFHGPQKVLWVRIIGKNELR